MLQRERTAIIADVSSEAAARLSDLLSARGYRLAACVRSGEEALRAVKALCPDLVALDAVLPEIDGLTAAERLTSAPLSVRPAILITSVLGFPIRRMEFLQSAGCAFLSKPVQADPLDIALAQTDVFSRRVRPEVALHLDALLDRLGVPQREGRRYLRFSILCAYQDMRLVRRLTGELYPMVARRHNVDARKVERDMRRTIEYAWKSGRIDEQYAIFGGTIDAQRGKPTCGEMIAQLADILRLEG